MKPGNSEWHQKKSPGDSECGVNSSSGHRERSNTATTQTCLNMEVSNWSELKSSEPQEVSLSSVVKSLSFSSCAFLPPHPRPIIPS